ncbi:MAG TPA: hypothetical protein VFV38_28565 [Ktedonobacteraceae bacterium]|nr:hypothetical protein [Ktedonobacteraceae bacterium]
MLQQATAALRLEMTTILENTAQAQDQALPTAWERIIQLQQEIAEGLRQSISDQTPWLLSNLPHTTGPSPLHTPRAVGYARL